MSQAGIIFTSQPPIPPFSTVAYGQVYNQSLKDIADGANFTFDSNGPLVNISHTVGSDTVVIGVSGTYLIRWMLNCSGTGGNITLLRNGVVVPIGSFSTNVSSTEPIGEAIVGCAAGDTIQLRNNTGLLLTTDFSAGYTNLSMTLEKLTPTSGGAGGATSFPTDNLTANELGGVLNIFGTPADGIHTSGAGNTVTISADPITVVAGSGISIAGSPVHLGGSVTISSSGSVPTTFHTSAGDAIPALNVLNVIGGVGIATSGAGNTVTISLTSTGAIETITGNNTGVHVPPTANDIKIQTNNATVEFIGNAGTSTVLLDFATTTNLGLGSGFPSLAGGTHDVAVGDGALGAITSGSDNTAIGYLALSGLKTGSNNTCIGSDAGLNYTGAESSNIIVGEAGGILGESNALRIGNTNTSGVQVTGINNSFLHNFGTNNTFVGSGSGNFTMSGTLNACLGANTCTALTTGGQNIAVGYQALKLNQSGAANIGIGVGALISLTTVNNNIGIGASALQLSNGANNIAIGASALTGITSGTNNIGIGNSVGSSAATGSESSNILIGSAGVNNESNAIHIGTSGGGAGQQNKCFIAGIDGVNVGSTAKVVTEASDQLGTATITAGTGVSIGTSANTITVNAVGGGVTWTVETTNQTGAVNHGYFCNKAGTLTISLPAGSVGDVIEAANINTALGTQFTQAAGQQIFLPNNTSTTLGVGGTLTSSAIGDTIKLVCRAANTWQCISMNGNWTVV